MQELMRSHFTPVTTAVILTLIHLLALVTHHLTQRLILKSTIAIRPDTVAATINIPEVTTTSAVMRLSTTLQVMMAMMKRHVRPDITTTRLLAKKLICRNAFVSTREKRRRKSSWVSTQEPVKRLPSMTIGT